MKVSALRTEKARRFKYGTIVLLILLAVLVAGCEENASGGSAKTDILQSDTLSETKEPMGDLELKAVDRYVAEPDVLQTWSSDIYKYYKILIDGVLNRLDVIELSENPDNNLYCINIFNQSPYDFLVEDFNYTENSASVYIKYRYTKEEQDETITFIESECLNILNSIIKKDYNDLEKTLAVYKYFGARISYDHERLEDMKKSSALSEPLYLGLEIYEALKTNKGICQTYAYLCRYALFQLGIDAFCIRGDSTSDPEDFHVWVTVKIDGKFYHIDPTWDREQEGKSGLRYFGVTDGNREKSGLIMPDFASAHQAGYGGVKCEDETLFVFKQVEEWEFYGEHIIKLIFRDDKGEALFDTVEKKVVG